MILKDRWVETVVPRCGHRGVEPGRDGVKVGTHRLGIWEEMNCVRKIVVTVSESLVDRVWLVDVVDVDVTGRDGQSHLQLCCICLGHLSWCHAVATLVLNLVVMVSKLKHID